MINWPGRCRIDKKEEEADQRLLSLGVRGSASVNSSLADLFPEGGKEMRARRKKNASLFMFFEIEWVLER